jgi:hypothetical protein
MGDCKFCGKPDMTPTSHTHWKKFGDTAVQAKILPDDAPNGEDTRFPLLPDTDFSVP